eukprot:3178289-Alexandrium_andersonii.AAC.1
MSQPMRQLSSAACTHSGLQIQLPRWAHKRALFLQETGTQSHTRATRLVAAHTLGLRTAAPCVPREGGSRCIDWALFRLKYFALRAA